MSFIDYLEDPLFPLFNLNAQYENNFQAAPKEYEAPLVLANMEKEQQLRNLLHQI